MSSELFLRAFVTICDRLDLTLVPGHDLRAGAHRGQRRVCFLCATRYLVALKRDLSISHYLLQSDRCSSSSSFQLTRRLRWRFTAVSAGRVVIFSMLAHTETMSLLYDEKWYSRCRVKQFWTLIYAQLPTNLSIFKSLIRVHNILKHSA